MSELNMREQFESWMLTTAKIIIGSSDPYPAGMERDYWRVWQVAWSARTPAPEQPAAEEGEIVMRGGSVVYGPGCDGINTKGPLEALQEALTKRETQAQADPTDNWFRVEVSDQAGQIVAIEPEMLAGRGIGESEEATIKKCIAHLSGFIGLGLEAQAEPVAEIKPWHEVPEDSIDRLVVGKGTQGDQMLAVRAIEEAQIYADLYDEFTDQIEPFVRRMYKAGAEYMPLPASLHGSFNILFDYWLRDQDCFCLDAAENAGRGSCEFCRVKSERGISLYTQPQRSAEQHPDDIAVEQFAAAMKEKLAKKRAQGRGG